MVSTKSTCNSPFSRPNIQAPLYQSCTFLAAFRTNLLKHCNFGTGVKDQQEFREAAERRERGAATTFHPQTACSTSFDKSKPQNGSPSAQITLELWIRGTPGAALGSGATCPAAELSERNPTTTRSFGTAVKQLISSSVRCALFSVAIIPSTRVASRRSNDSDQGCQAKSSLLLFPTSRPASQGPSRSRNGS
ncbi:hypothetical protein D6C88_01022 [Aureobasidium pullulans]|nr:hypothetical protein D6C88_01022 [Aureobasidium pullulans]